MAWIRTIPHDAAEDPLTTEGDVLGLSPSASGEAEGWRHG